MIASSITAGIHSDVAMWNEEADASAKVRTIASARASATALNETDDGASSRRAGLLEDLKRSADEVLDQIRAEHTSHASTLALQQVLQTKALELLKEHLAPSAPSAPTTPRSDRTADPAFDERVISALCQKTAQPDVSGTRQHLTESVCLVANAWRQTLAKASDGEMVELESVLALPCTEHDASNAAFEDLVQRTRSVYPRAASTAIAGGHDGLGTGTMALRPAEALRPSVDRMVVSLKPLLEQSFRRFNLLASEHEAEGLQLLRRAAVILLDHGLDTPEKVSDFLDEARSHDDWLAFLTGALAQVGYPVGMAAFLWGVAPTLIPTLLAGGAGIPGAIAFGAVAGAMIGYFDSVAGGGASAVRDAWRYEGSARSTSPLTAKLQSSQGRDIGIRMGISAAATFTKNALLRGVIPSIVYAAAFPSGINRAIRDHVDFACDAGGGFFSGGAANVLVRRSLDHRSSADLKLLAQENLLEVIQRVQGKGGLLRAVPRTASAYAAGLGCSALAPSTFAVTAGVMTPLVALLMGINIGMVPGLGLSQPGMGDGAPAPGSTWTGNDTTAGTPVAAELPMMVAEHALRSTVSTLLMAVLAGGATGVGQWVGRRADADCLAAVFGAVRQAAERLRDRVSPMPGRAAIELTGLRKRANPEQPRPVADGP